MAFVERCMGLQLTCMEHKLAQQFGVKGFPAT